MKSIFLMTLLFAGVAQAQDDLMKELEAMDESVNYAFATFKGTRLINLHTIETLQKGSLDFRISHRFAEFTSGRKNLWGLDGPATLRLGLDYSLTDRLVIGVSRTSFKKLFEGSLKYKFLRQAVGRMPITVTAFTSANITSEDDPARLVTGVDRYEYFSSRVTYVYQVMVARKFTSAFSAQIAPIFIHQNLVTLTNEKNDVIAMAGSARYKITRSVAITAEYVYRLSEYTPDEDTYFNVLGIGCDVETGGHVFQVFVTNGSAINEAFLIPYTTASVDSKALRFGFNISRVFEFGRRERVADQQK